MKEERAGEGQTTFNCPILNREMEKGSFILGNSLFLACYIEKRKRLQS